MRTDAPIIIDASIRIEELERQLADIVAESIRRLADYNEACLQRDALMDTVMGVLRAYSVPTNVRDAVRIAAARNAKRIVD